MSHLLAADKPFPAGLQEQTRMVITSVYFPADSLPKIRAEPG